MKARSLMLLMGACGALCGGMVAWCFDVFGLRTEALLSIGCAVICACVGVTMAILASPQGIAFVDVEGDPDADPDNRSDWSRAVIKTAGVRGSVRVGYVVWFADDVRLPNRTFHAGIGRDDVTFAIEGANDAKFIRRTGDRNAVRRYAEV